jgi:hypothetical protein
LSAKGRPQPITHWINCGRKFTQIPEISDLAAYSKSFNTWWASLQPGSRVTSSGLTRDVSAGETWAKTKKGGLNGFNSVVIALSFWLHNAKTEAQLQEFEEVLEDVLWVCNQMLAESNVSGKRPREDGEEIGPSKRSKTA